MRPVSTGWGAGGQPGPSKHRARVSGDTRERRWGQKMRCRGLRCQAERAGLPVVRHRELW